MSCEPDAASPVLPGTLAAAEDEDDSGRSNSVVGGISGDSVGGVDDIAAEGEVEASAAALEVDVEDASVVNDSATKKVEESVREGVPGTTFFANGLAAASRFTSAGLTG